MQIKMTITVREDCAEAGCRLPPTECDVCHIHDEPADEHGNCDTCLIEAKCKKEK